MSNSDPTSLTAKERVAAGCEGALAASALLTAPLIPQLALSPTQMAAGLLGGAFIVLGGSVTAITACTPEALHLPNNRAVRTAQIYGLGAGLLLAATIGSVIAPLAHPPRPAASYNKIAQVPAAKPVFPRKTAEKVRPPAESRAASAPNKNP